MTSKTLTKQSARAERERALAEKIRNSHTTTTKTYGVILADPPWRFQPYSRTTGMDRAADNHYPTLTVPEIRNLPIPAADHAVLFLWRTAPMLLHALSVAAAWGFTFKSELIWVKDRAGTGYWTRNMHEGLLIATRGQPPAPAPGTQSPSVLHAPATTHSTKPPAIYEMIERLYPTMPKVELFARIRRPGWDIMHSPEAEWKGKTDGTLR